MDTRSISINPNITNLKESSTLRVNQMTKAMRNSGEEVFHFGFGQSPFPVHEKIVKCLRDSAHEKDYLPTLGLLNLRKEIASYYKTKFNYNFAAERILVGPGSKELIFQCLYVLEGPVIIPAPSWVSYGPQVNVRGKHIVRALTKRENAYKLTAQELTDVCATLPDDEQKVLIINSPNNPSGQVYSDSEMESLAGVCRKENVIIISDEIYAMIDFSTVTKKGFSHYYPEGTIVTAGLSKSHSAGGYRLGFLAAPESMQAMITALSALVSETFSAVSAPIQYAATCAYSDDPEIEAYLKQCCLVHAAAGSYVSHRLNKINVDCPESEGAFYVFPDFNAYREKFKEKYEVVNSIELSELFLREASVALLPGADFYLPKDSLTARMATVDYDSGVLYEKSLTCKKLNFDFIEENCPHIVGGLNSLEAFLQKLKA